MLAFRGVLVQARPLGRPGWVRGGRKRARGHWAREREREEMGAEKFEDGRAIKSIRQIVSLQSPSW